ncbi:hypothetical protein ABZ957_14900 [Streptomyces sp. NPDC046316]|uniref:hypothetical protein n=1 Tax=Streptomyces sp. NPDC046316 TaxID=3154494 RepID=UPI0033DDA1BC
MRQVRVLGQGRSIELRLASVAGAAPEVVVRRQAISVGSDIRPAMQGSSPSPWSPTWMRSDFGPVRLLWKSMTAGVETMISCQAAVSRTDVAGGVLLRHSAVGDRARVAD